MTLMARLADLEDHIQALQVTGDQNGGAASMNGPTAAELQQLTQRIQALETGESRVRSEVESIRDDWSGITHKMRTASVRTVSPRSSSSPLSWASESSAEYLDVNVVSRAKLTVRTSRNPCSTISSSPWPR